MPMMRISGVGPSSTAVAGGVSSAIPMMMAVRVLMRALFNGRVMRLVRWKSDLIIGPGRSENY
jgi:hypothetical protein